jgi:A/G-specific adenine glycosylase
VARFPAPVRARPADIVGLRAALLAWFDRDGRALPFRFERDPDPWAVLVSEVMAQQTQVARVAAKWRAFMGRFPTSAAMASAPTGDVIRAWQGLGYNRRAIDLQRAARAIVVAGGSVPEDVDSLQALPGVGPYTARAVAAIAFGRPVGAVDVNVRRVLGRLTAADPAPVPQREMQATADALVDPARAGDWTHALMDLGATICRPARPECDACPVQTWCSFAAVAGVGPKAAPGPTPAPKPAPRPNPAPGPKAAPGQNPAPARRGTVPFEATTRWLRGRIVGRLCDVPPGTTLTFDGPLGLHAPEAVSAALASLAADGLVELDGVGAARLAEERA